MKSRQLIFLTLFLSLNVVAQDPFCETIITQGKSSVKQIPEIISFRIEFEVQDQDYQRCSNLTLSKIDTFKIAFIEKGLDPKLIKTTSYEISEEIERDSRTNKSVHIGYKSRIPIFIEAIFEDEDANKIFELLQSTFKSEVRINFRLSSVQVEEVEKELLFLAVEDATTKATTLANKLGIELGKVTKVQYGDPETIRNFTSPNSEFRSSPRPMGYTTQARIKTLTPVEISMGARVVIAWEIENE